MNGPLPESVRQAIATLTLDDKYALDRGRAFMSGIQALVRLPMLQHARDAAAGLRTAGFISGYRGSPLGGYDQALWQARQHLDAHQVVFQPGVNEELAATAVWGTQQLALQPQQARFDGVFGLWYGKGPGVDRCADVFKHANMAGTARHGGVVAVAGDDHVAKSSSLPHQSDHIFKACGLPVFFPSSVQEILDLGLHAFAMSRFAGLWAGLKTIQEVVESAGSVSVDPDRVQIVLPEDFEMPPGGLHIRWPDSPLEQEARMMDFKWYAALAYVRANRLNRTVIDSPEARLGLIASGKAYNDTRQALHDLGLDDAACARAGIRLHKVAVVWPLEAETTREFARGLQEILVIEEKRQMIEYQLKEELYNWREDVRPNVLGKFSEGDGDRSGGEWSRTNPAAGADQGWLLRAKADLNPALVARAIAQRLEKTGLLARLDEGLRSRIAARLAVIEAKEREQAQGAPGVDRPPWFCSGCPHNTSTRVPEGSRALAGIGCHYMAMWMDRRTGTVTQMGGEGVAWVGQAPFTTEAHVFANLGDGTYFHSGLLAIRQAVAAGVNITYKLLVNDAVAMTGGQPLDGTLKVPELTRELHAEGVRRIALVSDDPGRHLQGSDDAGAALAPGVEVFHRDQLDEVQRALRQTPGCTVIVYEQVCATELRRRRKRGKAPELAERVVINEAVCEGCGDCSSQSNCLSIEPVETALGRKRRINQHSCNQDFSCVKGFCPSFVTVQGGRLKSPRQVSRPDPHTLPPLPEPDVPAAPQAWGIVVAGIGGTGVITIGQLLGMAAHLEGKAVITQDSAGLAQKGGATWSHVQIADRPEAIHTTRVPTAAADLVIGCDAIVAALPATLAAMDATRTHVALNTHAAPTAAFVQDRDWQHPQAQCDALLEQAARPGELGRLDAHELATRLLGDALCANPLMLGYAWQRGWVPLGRAALLRAIELNGVQVALNHAAFEWGRRAAADPAGVRRLAAPEQAVVFVPARKAAPGLEGLLAQRTELLRRYQSEAYAQRYAAFVERVRQAEVRRAPGEGSALSEAVADCLARLMAYKDEYEVARLLSDPAFTAQIDAQFEPGWRLAYTLAPPLLAGRDAEGRPRKRHFGPWLGPLLKLLAHGRHLRGTAFDPFGWTAERRAERALVAQYQACIEELLAGLAPGNHAQAVQIAQLPLQIRGYGPVKQRSLEAVRARWSQALWAWRAAQAERRGGTGLSPLPARPA